ncbi:uncharacterized protein BYT42DRAFT_567889 [Radiomyces spectabilis]|uniref:uncharacterized protein n=1 Tax=Radiomyces spectabilis TaxID=64574 RepID=UPI00221FFB6A|nr:uncharacterized protein BYT42DRAFT_567889 [Radiomyces spectabilis]KAI8379189.1 hypothetical protein BYT42DRAFT_567889 [Radiomyces spectabilis]
MMDVYTADRQQSISPASSFTSSTSHKSLWTKLSHLLHRKSISSSRRNSSSTSQSSISSNDSMERSSSHRRGHRRKVLVDSMTSDTAPMVIPPFSPTYCKPNEFPYSNFYVKLPDGRWMIRYRSGNRDILRTDIVDGCYI